MMRSAACDPAGNGSGVGSHPGHSHRASDLGSACLLRFPSKARSHQVPSGSLTAPPWFPLLPRPYRAAEPQGDGFQGAIAENPKSGR